MKRKLCSGEDAADSEEEAEDNGAESMDGEEATLADVWQTQRHYIYQAAVQDGGHWMARFATNFKELRNRDARKLREDFCGTFLHCCEWISLNKGNTAVGIDNDPEVIAWGREEFGSPFGLLEEDEQDRIKILEQDILQAGSSDSFDVICALNFSYSIFKERAVLVKYFRLVYESLEADGVFFLDAHGGSSICQSGLKVVHEVSGVQAIEEAGLDGVKYEWEQIKWDPITSSLLCAIHFAFPDGSRMDKAFVYDWRYWSLSELQDALQDAGFTKVHVFFPDVDAEGKLTGEYSKEVTGRDDETFNAYLAAER
jgi:hypothetical protein